jgi:hypothetical protein
MITYRILPAQRLILVLNRGETLVEECMRLLKELRSDPDYSPIYNAMVDVSKLDRQYTSDEIRQMSAINLAPVKVAIVAPAEVSFGMSRMFELRTEDKRSAEFRVFRDRATALTWLGRSESDLKRIL